jgi:hypothetical protein
VHRVGPWPCRWQVPFELRFTLTQRLIGVASKASSVHHSPRTHLHPQVGASSIFSCRWAPSDGPLFYPTLGSPAPWLLSPGFAGPLVRRHAFFIRLATEFAARPAGFRRAALLLLQLGPGSAHRQARLGAAPRRPPCRPLCDDLFRSFCVPSSTHARSPW